MTFITMTTVISIMKLKSQNHWKQQPKVFPLQQRQPPPQQQLPQLPQQLQQQQPQQQPQHQCHGLRHVTMKKEVFQVKDQL